MHAYDLELEACYSNARHLDVILSFKCCTHRHAKLASVTRKLQLIYGCQDISMYMLQLQEFLSFLIFH